MAEPRLGAGFAASVLLHGGLVAAFFVLRPGAPPPGPPIYRVRLIAAPAGERAIGVVQPKPEPVVEKPAPVTPPKPTPKKAPPSVKTPPKPTKQTPTAATPTPTPPTKKAEPAPTAGGGPTGGRGADIANVVTTGVEFPYPAYSDNIVRQLIKFFGQTNARFTAEVSFVIRRDGTVDPETIRFVTRSGNYSFDQRAYGAVEAAANANAFGALPSGFREDILPVRFRFTPSIMR
ncbi:MAG TPA: TonB C-terminal domain-containing protein [Gemmatimonadaceae bacterium]|nr:TonB C-terminal domain-containing protein [Gemmatimonadaceae bacterium]